MRKVLLCSLLFSSSVAFSAPAPKAPETANPDQPKTVKINFEEQLRNNLKVEKFTLKNGLRVLLHVDHTIPVIVYNQWFKVGSVDEKEGRTGLAHFFEHLMFKGTPRISGKDYEQMIHANGGANNAFTTRDYTGYYTYLPSDKLKMVIDIESDRMQNLLFNEKEINSEREVVKEERRMRYENDIFGALNELLYKTVYKTSQYRWPVIGYMADLNATSVAELKDFYRLHYAPNNAVVVIAGSFDPKQAKRWIEDYYGKIPSQPVPETKPIAEENQTARRTEFLKKNVQNPTVSIVYTTPAVGDKDNYALDLLANILGEGNSSRLYKALVYRDQIGANAGVNHSNSKYGGMFQFSSSLKPGVSISKFAPEVDKQIAAVQKAPVSALELEKAKNQIMRDYIGGLKTVAGKGRALALNEIYFNDYTMLFKDLALYEAVTPADVMRVAKQYLVASHSSLVAIEPGVEKVSKKSKESGE